MVSVFKTHPEIFQQSIDGKSRWAAHSAIGAYIHTYNFELSHSALDYRTLAECNAAIFCTVDISYAV